MASETISLRHLRYFVAAVDSGSISQAAAALAIAQPAVGQQIADLEAKLGAKLLARTTRGVRPTEVGRMLYAQAQAILRQVGQLPTLVQAGGQDIAGEVSLGLASSLAARLTAPLLAAARLHHPQIRVKIVEGTSVTIRAEVNTQRVDLGMVFESRPAPGVVRSALFRQRLFAFEHEDMTPDGGAKGIDIAQLASRPLILPSAPNTIRATLDRAFLEQGLVAEVIAETTSLPGLFAAVDAGLGTIVLAMGEAPPALRPKAARVRPLEPAIWLTASTITSALNPPNSAALALQKLLCDVVADRVSSGAWAGAEQPSSEDDVPSQAPAID